MAIIASGRKHERYFFGKTEVMMPVYRVARNLPDKLRQQANLFINLVSGRRVLTSTKANLSNCCPT